MTRVKSMVMVAALVALGLVAAPARAGLLNYWTFDNAGSVGQATVGTDVTASGDAQHTAAGQSGGGNNNTDRRGFLAAPAPVTDLKNIIGFVCVDKYTGT